MARITVEDCLLKVENRFELISLCSKRSKEIIKQKRSLLTNYKNRPIVMSLREISSGKIWPDRD